MQKFLKNQNYFLWMPVIMAFGAALYFTYNSEPWIPYPCLCAAFLGAILLFVKMPIWARAICAFVFGFIYAAGFTSIISTHHIKYDMRDINVNGVVIDSDFTFDKQRIILSTTLDDAPVNIRLSVPGHNISVGDTINATISVFPLSQMEAPETFDYERWAYFQGISATGFITDYHIIEHKHYQLRALIHNVAKSALVDSLILGYKNAINPDDKKIWTDVGIAHVWSISGFHMTLVGGWLFALFYLIFRFCTFITRRIPARIPATVCAWLGLVCYLFISGGGIATMRAFIMTSLLFLAIILGRNVISMRNVCIAFLILFLINPHNIMQAGFQLSFAAIFGLIWFWGRDTTNVFLVPESQHKFLHWVYVAVMTTVIATVFTAPFIITHFNSIPLYSLIGNIVLVPIFSFAIMPLVVIGAIAALCGMHGILDIANNVYNFALVIGDKIASLPYATVIMPHVSNAALTCIIIGMFMMIFIVSDKDAKSFIMRKINYCVGLTFILIGIIVIAATPKPVFYITSDHELIGMAYDGKLEFNKARAANHYFAFNTFRKLYGEAPADTNIRHKCQDGVCIYKAEKFSIAYIQKFVPLHKNLQKLCKDKSIDYIVSYFDISSKTCESKILKGGFVIYPNKHIKYTQSNRLWHTKH